jgi:hypothetical protein
VFWLDTSAGEDQVLLVTRPRCAAAQACVSCAQPVSRRPSTILSAKPERLTNTHRCRVFQGTNPLIRPCRRTRDNRPKVSYFMITLKNVTCAAAPRCCSTGVNVTINPGEKVGLVGRNGAGKSTLFALLNGTLHEDGGDFLIPPNGAWPRWRRTCPKPTKAPPTSWWPATPAWPMQRSAQLEATGASRRPTTAWPLPTPTPTWHDAGATTPCRARRR